MKRVVTALLIIELLIAYFILTPTCILRGDHVRAFAAWHENPMPATKAELDRQKRITRLHSFGFSAVMFGIMAGVTLLIAWTFRQKDSTAETRTA